MQLYKPFPAKQGDYKYFVWVLKNNKPKKIGYGNKNYQQYFDKFGHYSNLNHLDPERRRRYLARASKIRNKKGQLTANDKNSANYWSIHYLW